MKVEIVLSPNRGKVVVDADFPVPYALAPAVGSPHRGDEPLDREHAHAHAIFPGPRADQLGLGVHESPDSSAVGCCHSIKEAVHYCHDLFLWTLRRQARRGRH